MIYINKHEEPDWLIDFKNNHPGATYDSNEFEGFRRKLKENLVKEQKCLCAYCCCKIDVDHSHNEHIEPRHPGIYESRKSLDYSNIVASCYGFQRERTCGSKKENEYDESEFISPLDPKCENIFSYYPNGVIEGNKYTIDLLNLNSYRLKRAREAVYNTIKDLDGETLRIIYPQDEEELEPFINVVKWFIKNNF